MKMNQLEKKIVNSKRHALGNRKTFERIIGNLDISEAKGTLEIGCGAGDLSNYLAQTYDLHVTGTDVDPEQIEIAKVRYSDEPRLSFRTADTTSLPFENGSFDIVISFKVLHHIKDWNTALGEVSRVLRPGGYYILNDFALPAWACRTLGRVAKNSGLYTVENASNALQDNEMMPTWREHPKGIFLRHFSFISRKAS
jgi:ubiquinone/menaquinone biosynthesis C-methylase UbiE